MAPGSSSDPHDSRDTSRVEGNPFIAFRRFADEQISSILQSFIGLPSTFSSHLESRWPDDPRPRHQDSNMRGWGSTSNSEDPQAGCGSARDAEPPATRYTQDNPWSFHFGSKPYQTDDLDQPWRGYGANSSFHDHLIFSHFGLPSFWENDFLASSFSGLLSFQWPLGFLVTSGYSPLFLERNERLRCQGTRRWREAFEDLLLAEQGKPLPNRELKREDSQERESPECWIAGMLEKGVLPGWRKLDEPPERLSNGTWGADSFERQLSRPEPDGEEQTELDLYERFLGSQYPSQSSSGPGKAFVANESTMEDGKPQIISTLTTTERKTLPDGSVHTKVVLKKRFADGQEESSETVHTTASGQGKASTMEKDVEKSSQDEKKGGWFWSK